MERGNFSKETLPHSAESIDELIDRNDKLAHFILAKILKLIREES